MKVRALTSFSGVNLSMYQGQELDIKKEQAEEYSACGFVEILREKKVKKNESK
ncbi:MAG: hypothetical protein ACOCNL_05200 [Acetivibrio ethanolgignens]